MKFTKPTLDWKRTICIDFDGVIAEYHGWKGANFFGNPKKGIRDFLAQATVSNFKVVVFTLRPEDKIWKWFKVNKLPLPSLVTNVKVPAFVYIDDRGLKFNGDFSSLFEEVKNYKAYWETESQV